MGVWASLRDAQTLWMLMELIALWNLFRRRWWLAALPAGVALILTLPVLGDALHPPVTYQVQMRLSAATPPDAALEGVSTPYEDAVYVPLIASEYVVVNMAQWITSDRFAAEAQHELDTQAIALSGGSLNTAFAADSLRSILTLYVTWDNPDEIQAITQAAITVLQTRNQSYFAQFAAQPVEVIPLDDIEVGQVAPPVTTRLNPLIRIVLGLMAGVGLVVLAEYLDASLHTRDEVEALGLVVLAEIPHERRRVR